MVSPVSSPSLSNESSFASPSSNPTYTVESGDTLDKIARQHGVGLNELLAANPQINNPDVIYVGDQINLPPASTHTVQPGENLTDIAARFGTTVNELVRLNGIDNPNRIYVGDVLQVPNGQNAAPTEPTVPVTPGEVLARGSQGPAVSELQAGLNQLGYRAGAVDGQYGPLTEQAVRTFQADFGLSATGTADSSTQAVLDQTLTSPTALERGSSGGEVSSLQRSLTELGFAPGSIDGQFGPKTQAAVSQFQAANDLSVTGTVDEATLTALRSGDANGPGNTTPVDPSPVDPGGPVASTWDAVSDARIQSLHPDLRAQAAAFVNAVEAELGVQVRVTSGLRTFAEQDALYNQGRTTPGNIVTNARAGRSYHNYGLALDVVPMLNGQPQWNSPHWDAIGAIGKRMGFEWGGDFRSLVDKPHFQMTQGMSTRELLDLYNSGQRDGPYVRL